MAAHAWAFPWIALFCGCAALLVAFFRAPFRFLLTRPGPGSLALALVWLMTIVALFLVARHIGDVVGIDVIPPRGILMGALLGGLLVLFGGRVSAKVGVLAVFGIATAGLSANWSRSFARLAASA